MIMVFFKPDSSARNGALDSLSCSIHGDAVGMKTTSHFVCAKGDAWDIYRKSLPPHWFPGNGEEPWALDTAILFPYQWNSRRRPAVVCKWRAEWIFSPKPKSWVSRPSLWTVRVTAM